jgi:RsiW-degrading membrane proteinase PrsW (M82 family)
VPFAVAVLPVLAFLAALVVIDSFKLVPARLVVRSIAVGAAAALLVARLNALLLDGGAVSHDVLTRYVAPLLEESIKAAFVVWLIASRRVGFLVDAAIHGFALGAGFAVVENLEYLRALGGGALLFWVARGFGTALLHGAATSILAMIAKALADRWQGRAAAFLPGWAAAVALHSAFNHFVLPPLAAAALLLVVLPVLVVVVFERSEKATHAWLATGLDADVEVLRLILSDDVGGTRVGTYLRSLRSRFAGTVVADMLCLLRIQLELSIRARGLLMAREAGIPFPVGADVAASLNELRYLEKSIGRTGLLALKPLEVRSGRDFWEVYLLQQAAAATAAERGSRAAP